ncbi:MAG TPA: acyltransferase domain-containing protein [Geomonas sp.]|nr:acyltransferase domain-containing protein [Geomonas sp.]
MNCFMFPGQPLSRDAALPDDADFAEIRELVRSITRLDLDSFQWQAGEGTENVKLQVYGVAQSLYRLRALRRQGIRPDLVTQHSMGIYPSLVACGSLPEPLALEMTWRVGLAMAGMAGKQQYALGCVIGLTEEPLQAVASNNSVHLANYNTSRHFLLCGVKDDISSALAEATAKGAFSVSTFDCDAPLHTPLMAALELDLLEIFADYLYLEPVCPLIDHLDQRPLDAAGIPVFLLRELSRPVFWDRTYRALRRAGAGKFYELGCAQSLTKYNRWIESEIAA